MARINSHKATASKKRKESLYLVGQKKKQQASVDFLTTYGWAILVIAAVLILLIYLNVFNSSTFVSNTCIGENDLYCNSADINTTGKVLVGITSELQYPINITAVACSNNPNDLVFHNLTQQITVEPSQEVELSTNCLYNGANFTGTTGTVFSGYVAIKYYDTINDFPGGAALSVTLHTVNQQITVITTSTTTVSTTTSTTSTSTSVSTTTSTIPSCDILYAHNLSALPLDNLSIIDRLKANNLSYNSQSNPYKIYNSRFLHYPLQPTAFVNLIGIKIGNNQVTVPSGVLEYALITLKNNQSQPTPNPYQQLIQINSSEFLLWSSIAKYGNNFGQNVVFFYPNNGTVIPSWLANYSSSNAYWWIKVNGIPANSQEVIAIGFGSQLTNFFNTNNVGEAPQLPCGNTPVTSCSLYAEYDDGANVFPFYDNFIGTSLNGNLWTTWFSWFPFTFTIDNSATFSQPRGWNFIYSNNLYSRAVDHTLVTYYQNSYPNSSCYKPYIGWLSTSIRVPGQYEFTGLVYYENINSTGTGYYEDINPTGTGYYVLVDTNNFNGTFTIQYVYVTDYPPNGVMPSYKFSNIRPVV
ncbi:MAG: hypothetical protein ARM1_0573 [Candidatus Micrarchaeota archaeon]|nr:MAG: hypothetical protein ARM1_0573 [Candidatus Micrarchaeota archaeon]